MPSIVRSVLDLSASHLVGLDSLDLFIRCICMSWSFFFFLSLSLRPESLPYWCANVSYGKRINKWANEFIEKVSIDFDGTRSILVRIYWVNSTHTKCLMLAWYTRYIHLFAGKQHLFHLILDFKLTKQISTNNKCVLWSAIRCLRLSLSLYFSVHNSHLLCLNGDETACTHCILGPWADASTLFQFHHFQVNYFRANKCALVRPR